MAPTPTRRTFLRDLAAGAALLPALPGTLAAAPTTDLPGAASTPLPPAPAEPDEAYWGMVRARFAFEEARVPMNAANLCPSPREVAERVTRLTHEVDVDCSFQNRAAVEALREEARTKVAEHLRVSPDEVALVRNTSEANNTVNAGLELEPGDEVVIWDQNHPTNHVAWTVRAARYGIRVRTVSTPPNPGSVEELAAPFLEALGPRTRVVAVSHLSNVSGTLLPIPLLAEATRPRGIHLHVDGAQSWGALDVDLPALGCDSYASSTHKWLMGPKEAGLLWVREERVPHIWPAGVAPGWGSDAEPDVVGARKFESLGQRDDACLAAVGTAVEVHRIIGADRVEARVRELAALLKEGMADLGATLVTPSDPALSGGVVIVEAANPRGVFERMYREHGVAGAPTGGLRLSPHVYNTREHVERALAGARALRSDIVGR